MSILSNENGKFPIIKIVIRERIKKNIFLKIKSKIKF
jgi:hypothetical protein